MPELLGTERSRKEDADGYEERASGHDVLDSPVRFEFPTLKPQFPDLNSKSMMSRKVAAEWIFTLGRAGFSRNRVTQAK